MEMSWSRGISKVVRVYSQTYSVGVDTSKVRVSIDTESYSGFFFGWEVAGVKVTLFAGTSGRVPLG